MDSPKKRGYDEDVQNFSVRANSPIFDGLVGKRKCTDCGFLLVFLLFLGSMGYLTVMGYQKGDLPKLLAPLDGDLKFCGIDYEGYPYLLITDFASTNINQIFGSGICVSECPKDP